MSTFFFFLPLLLLYTVFAVYAERKIAGFIQDRTGPMETGYYGLLQTVADLLKLIQKEDIIPSASDRKLFLTAPLVIFLSIFAGFAVLPLAPGWGGATTNLGVFFLLAVVSLDVIGILMAGWGSNSKYSLFGAMRAIAQIVSYEIPLGLSVLCVIVFAQSLNLQEISMQQGVFGSGAFQYLFGMWFLPFDMSGVGGFLTWNIFRMPLLIPVFIIFFIASLAECNRAPFDLPESESELIGGFHTEYSGFRWAMIMLSEYGMMLLVSFLGSILFLGAWNTALPNLPGIPLADWTSGTMGELSAILWGLFWLLSKTFSLVGLQMIIRWTYPRLRVDQLMSLCWKYLTPAALVLLLLIAAVRILMMGS
ncbi:MAG: NADH-quinone oxidoreductase subunit H [Cyclobacteriaceae bacterium]|nr:NADH-quinone oxidoreductase subunit H [Cyclobacteriaceae bacterium]MCH8515828.1 NADH-quinone oxidoreductase subunit H [Cyclobacteriaceae bacterium]